MNILTEEADQPNLLQTYIELATVYEVTEKFEKAVEFYEKALAVALEIGDERRNCGSQ
jgi:hypothetical protein